MIRHWKILEYALLSLLRRKGRNAAVGVVFVFTVAVLASILFLTHALKEEARRLLLGAPDLIVQSVAGGRHELIQTAAADPIRRLPGVAGATPRIWGYYYDAITDSNYTVLAGGGGDADLAMLTGRGPTSPGECALGAGVAGAWSVAEGDDLILVDSENIGVVFQVVGVFTAESSLLTNDLVVLSEADVRAFFGIPPDRATDIVVQVNNPREIATVAQKIKRIFPRSRPITKAEILRTYDAVFNWRSGMIFAAFGAALVAFCILAWDKATGISAEEKREIGILKAVGWDTADVLALKFWEGLALSLSSLLLGLIIAYVHVFFMGAALLAPVLKGWSVLFPEFRLVPRLAPEQLIVVALLTVIPYVASTVIPAWKSAVTDPESVMRG